MAGIQVTRIRVTTTSGAGTAAETACTELDLPEDVGVGEREKTTTASAFLSCVSASARNDERLKPDQSRALQIKPTLRGKDIQDAALVGESFRKYGDALEEARIQICNDSLIQQFVDCAVADSDGGRASENAFKQFSDIAKEVLDVDGSGKASGMTFGRLAALFLFGYEICSGYIRRHGKALFMKFISKILEYMIKFLKSIGFYEWLTKHGWKQLLGIKSYVVNRLIFGTAAVVVVVGAIAAIWYLRKRQ